MPALVGRRLLQLVPVILGVTIVTFLLLNLLPGDPAVALLGPDATPQALASLRHSLGLDGPIPLRYWHWLTHALRGNLGTSLSSGQAVTQILGQRVPVSLELIVLAQLFALVTALPMALLAASRRGKATDRAVGLTAYTGVATPHFLLGIVLILVVSVKLGWLPATGWTPLSAGLWPNLRTAILPSLTLSFSLYAVYMRVLRGDLVAQLANEDYVSTARAKGLAPWTVLRRHVLRNSTFPLITVVGLTCGSLFSGGVIVETLFAVPGLGQELINSIYQRDAPVVQGIVVFVAVVFVLINLLVDVLYAVLDPRIRYGRSVA